jgi:hypothetical protein
MTDEATLVAIHATGEISEFDIRSGASRPRSRLALSAEIAAGDIDVGGGRVAFLDGRDVVVAGLSDAIAVERFEARGLSCDPYYPFPGEASFVDLDDDGDDLAVVSCSDGTGRGFLQIATNVGDGLEEETFDLRYDLPSSVSIADGGGVAVVSSFRGQIGVLKDGAWIEPAELQSERFGGVGYQQGWAATDPSGRLVLTRRDLKGVELWLVDASQMARVAQVANTFEPEFPVGASFTGTDMTLDRGSGEVDTWSLERAHMVDQACDAIPDSLPEYSVAAGVTTVPCGEQGAST